jgi:tetratricopeptide (TPR) repeat protein
MTKPPTLTHEDTMCESAELDDVIHAMQRSDELALSVINDTLARWPRDYRLWFLRGSVQASRRQNVDARVDFKQTLILAPDFHVARFALGVLELIHNLPEDAAATWAPLDDLANNHGLRVLKDGLINLSADRFDIALEQLKRGMALNADQPAINAYIQSVVQRIDGRTSTVQPEMASNADANHLLLSGYLASNTRH